MMADLCTGMSLALMNWNIGGSNKVASGTAWIMTLYLSALAVACTSNCPICNVYCFLQYCCNYMK